jgi:hypothetical protein
MFALSRLEWLVLAAALLLCPALTWSAEPDTASLFDRLDRNRDGYLSKAELSVPEANDGRISRSEFSAVLAQPAPQQQPSAAAGGSKPAPRPEAKKPE